MIRQALLTTAMVAAVSVSGAMAQDSNSQNMGGSTGCTNENTTTNNNSGGTATGDCAQNTIPEPGGTGVDSAPGVTGSSTPPTNQNGQDVPSQNGTTGTTSGSTPGTGSGSDVTPSN